MRRANAVVVIGAVAAIAACYITEPESGTAEPSQFTVAVSLLAAPEVTQVRLRVMAPDLPSALWFPLVIEGDVASGSAGVPAGPARTFTLQALDASSVVRYQGSTTMNVAVGANAPLTITMLPVDSLGNVPIVGVIGTYTVAVTPPTLALTPGQSANLTATVRDPGGAVVSGAVVTWESLNSGVATVSAPGLVTAVAAGSATIAARYGSSTGTATVTVTATATYTLSLSPAALSIAPGGSSAATVSIARTNFTGAVTLSLGGNPAGVTGSFAPAAPTGTSSTLTLNVASTVAPGTYNLTVNGSASAGARSTPLTLTVTSVTPGSRTYSTTFATTEKPISEGGNWINGRTVGLDWADVATAGGVAHGVHVPVRFADPTALLTGPWSPNQQAEGVVFGVDALGEWCSTESQIRLRSAIGPRVNRGYEIFWSLRADNSYVQVVRWNGALGDFKELYNTGAGGPRPVNGYTLRARMVGDVITIWVLNAQGTVVWTDSVADRDGPGGHAVFADGAPGMGFWIGSDCLTNLLNENRFGFSSFSATDAMPPQ